MFDRKGLICSEVFPTFLFKTRSVLSQFHDTDFITCKSWHFCILTNVWFHFQERLGSNLLCFYNSNETRNSGFILFQWFYSFVASFRLSPFQMALNLQKRTDSFQKKFLFVGEKFFHLVISSSPVLSYENLSGFKHFLFSEITHSIKLILETSHPIFY